MDLAVSLHLISCSHRVRVSSNLSLHAAVALMPPAREAAEDVGADWQNLGLEQDVLLQIFEKISSSQAIQLSGVSSGWKKTIYSVCGPWSKLEITARQSQSDSFAAWLGKQGRFVRHLKITKPVTPQHNIQGHYLRSMTGLESYLDLAGASVQSLSQLASTVKRIEAKFTVPAAETHDPQIALGTLSHITELSLDCQMISNQHTNVYLHLPDTSLLEQLTLTSYGFSRVDFHLLDASAFHTVRSIHLSFISTQAQLEQIMTMTALKHMHVGIDTARSVLGDGIDLAGIEALVNLEDLHLRLHTCYLRNAHMLQRLPHLQVLGIDMSDDVAVLFRPEDGSSFAMPCLLNNVQHVELVMHSVFDVTDCLEGLNLVSRAPSLLVILHQSSSRGPSEVHWAIKEGSILARAVNLRHLSVECTSMLINLLPPKLESLQVTAKKVNVKADLRTALSRLDRCILKARLGVEYF